MAVAGESRAIRTYLVDDHEIVRRGLRSVLEMAADIEVVGHAPDGRAVLDAFAAAPEPPADVVLMDLVMPVLDGISASRELRERHPSVRILVLTSFGDLRQVRAALEIGVAGYLLKDAEAETVLDAVRRVFRGQLFLDPRVSATLAGSFSVPQQEITLREREVLRLVARGLSSQEMAAALFISERTARTHISHLLMKLGMRSRIQLALWASANGFEAEGPR